MLLEYFRIREFEYKEEHLSIDGTNCAFDQDKMTTESFPAAEAYARRMKLPLTICQTTLELYGYQHVVLDEMEARSTLAEAGFHASSGGGQVAQDAAIAILRKRVELLKARSVG